MALRFFTIGTLVAVTALAAAADVSTSGHTHLRPSVAPGSSPLRMFGVRGAQQRGSSAAKFDGALADLSRHAHLVRPGHAVEDLQSLAPGVKFVQTAAGAAPLVLIDAVTVGDPQQLKNKRPNEPPDEKLPPPAKSSLDKTRPSKSVAKLTRRRSKQS